MQSIGSVGENNGVRAHGGMLYGGAHCAKENTQHPTLDSASATRSGLPRWMLGVGYFAFHEVDLALTKMNCILAVELEMEVVLGRVGSYEL
jgi:hypothetical protein